MKVRFFNPGVWYGKHKKEIDRAMQNVLTRGDLILRDDVEKFEKNLAEFVGTKYAVGLNSGTDALYLALKALGIREKDKVLVPSHTFVATAQVVAQMYAKPVLYDMDGSHDIEQKYVAQIIGHISGEVSKEIITGLPTIDDSCQALGAIKNPTSFAQCWSFYPAKTLGAYGDAGALTTNSEEVYNEVKELRNHYKKDYSKWGVNSRLDNIQAAILNVKFKYLPELIARRKEIAEFYLRELDGVVGLPNDTPGRVWQDFIINVGIDRDNVYDFLKRNGIETMKNEYPMPIKKLPLSLKYESETLRIPCNPDLTDKEVEHVARMIKKFYGC